jgi:transcriptional regulator GlxA family with amidase domain
VGPDGTLGSPEVLLVPGGGWGDRADTGAWAEYDRGEIPDAIASAHARGATIATVCTGGMLAAGAGILEGRPATTHHVAHDDLREVAEFVDARVVDAGDVITCGGVTAGIDLAFHFLAREFGEELRDRVARRIEYEPSEDVYLG